MTVPAWTEPAVEHPAVTAPDVTHAAVTTPVVQHAAVTVDAVVTTPAWTEPAVTTPAWTTPAVVTTPAFTTKGAEIAPAAQLVWNLCSYLDWDYTPDSALAKSSNMTAETFAYVSKNGKIIPLTSEILPMTQAVNGTDGVVNGIETLFTSSEDCESSGVTGEKYSFKTTVLCNANITGAAEVTSVTGTTSCRPTVTMEHESGCPLFSFSGVVKFFDDNTWLSGTVLFVLGVVMVLFGCKFFRWVMGAIGALVGFMAVMYLTSIFGWLGATWSLILWIVLALVAGLACGYFTYMFLPISIGLLGAAGGFVAGAALFSLILSITGYDALWLLITLVVAGAIAAGILGFKFRNSFLIITTSMVGGYMLMRGLTFWFGGYPSEMEMFGMMAHG